MDQNVSINYDTLTVVELRDMARANGILGVSAMKKAELIQAIKVKNNKSKGKHGIGIGL